VTTRARTRAHNRSQRGRMRGRGKEKGCAPGRSLSRSGAVPVTARSRPTVTKQVLPSMLFVPLYFLTLFSDLLAFGTKLKTVFSHTQLPQLRQRIDIVNRVICPTNSSRRRCMGQDRSNLVGIVLDTRQRGEAQKLLYREMGKLHDLCDIRPPIMLFPYFFRDGGPGLKSLPAPSRPLPLPHLPIRRTMLCIPMCFN